MKQQVKNLLGMGIVVFLAQSSTVRASEFYPGQDCNQLPEGSDGWIEIQVKQWQERCLRARKDRVEGREQARTKKIQELTDKIERDTIQEERDAERVVARAKAEEVIQIVREALKSTGVLDRAPDELERRFQIAGGNANDAIVAMRKQVEVVVGASVKQGVPRAVLEKTLREEMTKKYPFLGKPENKAALDQVVAPVADEFGVKSGSTKRVIAPGSSHRATRDVKRVLKDPIYKKIAERKSPYEMEIKFAHGSGDYSGLRLALNRELSFMIRNYKGSVSESLHSYLELSPEQRKRLLLRLIKERYPYLTAPGQVDAKKSQELVENVIQSFIATMMLPENSAKLRVEALDVPAPNAAPLPDIEVETETSTGHQTGE